MQLKNELSRSKSLYLQQHAHQPVAWQLWEEDTFKKATQLNRPIFLSIGYSSCHWCHVMAHESFDSQDIALILNEHFIPIKVDREERPDVDQIYMNAVQLQQQQGGWPLNVFLTPEKEPFFGGTYYPPVARSGYPSFSQILGQIQMAWEKQEDQLRKGATELTQALRQFGKAEPQLPGQTPCFKELFEKASQEIIQMQDEDYGGLGRAPKFFHVAEMEVLLEKSQAQGCQTSFEAVTHFLHAICKGGIYDHLRGGFHRYSTDLKWLVPHFEKMLYDNALLVGLMAKYLRVQKDPLIERNLLHTLSFVLEDMQDSKGGFFSTIDADSEGVEGKYYVWAHSELVDIFGSAGAKFFSQVFNATHLGNFEGNNILHLTASYEEMANSLGIERAEFLGRIDKMIEQLFEKRKLRVAPVTDKKMILSWNGMMIQGVCEAYKHNLDPLLLKAAMRSVRAFLGSFTSSKDLPIHALEGGEPVGTAFLDDMASMILGLLSLYEVDPQLQWIKQATQLAEGVLEHFWQEKEKTFVFSSLQDESLPVRHCDWMDNATPSSTGMIVKAFFELSRITGEMKWEDYARECLQAYSSSLSKMPHVASLMTRVGYEIESAHAEIWLVGELMEKKRFQKFAWEHPVSRLKVYLAPEPNDPLYENQKAILPVLQGKETSQGVRAYFCHQKTCEAPINDLVSFSSRIEKWRESL